MQKGTFVQNVLSTISDGRWHPYLELLGEDDVPADLSRRRWGHAASAGVQRLCQARSARTSPVALPCGDCQLDFSVISSKSVQRIADGV